MFTIYRHFYINSVEGYSNHVTKFHFKINGIEIKILGIDLCGSFSFIIKI